MFLLHTDFLRNTIIATLYVFRGKMMRIWSPRIIAGAKLKYLGIVDALEVDIRKRILKPGDRLPPQRAIAQQLNIDLTTVTRAINEASKRGLVESVQGSGCFIAQTAFSIYSSLNLMQGKMIDLSMNNPPLPEIINLPQEIVSGIQTITSSDAINNQLNYQETAGNPLDREAGKTFLADKIPNLDSDQLVITSGAHSAIFAIMGYLKIRTIAAPTLTYPGLRAISDYYRYDVASIEMDQHGIIPEDLVRICEKRAPEALYVVPNIDNPTTSTLTKSRRMEIVRIAEKYNVVLIEDDPYAAFIDEDLPSLYSLAPERTWYIATLSKCVSPSMRTAYVVAPDKNEAALLAESMRVSSLMAPPLMTALASQWINDNKLASISHAIKLENQKRQVIVANIFKGTSFQTHPNSPHFWLSLPSAWRSLDFAEQAHRSGISIVPCTAFVSDRSNGQGVRVSLGVSASSQSLENALEILVGLIHRPPSRTRAIV